MYNYWKLLVVIILFTYVIIFYFNKDANKKFDLVDDRISHFKVDNQFIKLNDSYNNTQNQYIALLLMEYTTCSPCIYEITEYYNFIKITKNIIPYIVIHNCQFEDAKRLVKIINSNYNFMYITRLPENININSNSNSILFINTKSNQIFCKRFLPNSIISSTSKKNEFLKWVQNKIWTLNSNK